MNCKNCIHWGKCSKTNGKTRYCGETIASDNVEELCEWFISTADVVPKSEVERLSKELDELAEEYSDLIVEKDRTFDEAEVWYKKAKELEVELDAMRSAANSYKMHYNNLAREIFEEIETCMKNFEDDDDGYLLKKCEFEFFMRELKKEYAEEKE